MSKTVSARLWTKDFILVSLINFLTFTTVYVMNASLSLYGDNLQVSTVITGLMVTLFALTAAAIRPLAGNLSDRFGRKLFMVIGSAIFAASLFAFGTLTIIPVLLASRIIQGIGFGSVSTASGAAAADVIPPSRMGEGMGYYGMGMGLAMALGPVLGLELAGVGKFKLLYLVTAMILLACLVIALLVTYEKKNKMHHSAIAADVADDLEKHQGIRAVIWKIFEKRSLPTSFAYCLFAIAMASLISFLPLFAKESQIGNVSIFYIVEAVMIFLSRMLAGRLFDRLGPLPVIIPSMIIGASSFVLIILSAGGWLFWLSAALFGISLGINLPVFNALAIQSASPQRRGAASATFYLFVDVGVGVGGGIWGVLLDLTDRNYDLMFGGSALCLILAMLVSIVIYRNVKPKKNTA